MADGYINLNSETPQIKRKWRAVVVICGGILIHLTLGTFYSFGNFSQYIVSYLRYRSGERDLTNVDALWVPNSGKPTQCIGLVVGGFLFQRFGARIATAVGCAIFSGAVLLSYFAVQKSFIAFVFTYGVMFGFGTSCTYASPLTAAVKWLPNRPGLAGGFIVAGYGAGASIFNQIITQYINPDNKVPDIIEGSDRYFSDNDLLDRVPACFLILGATYMAMQMIGIIMITSPPDEDAIVQINANGRNGNSIKRSNIQYDTFQPVLEDLNNSLGKYDLAATEINGSVNANDMKSQDIEKGDMPLGHGNPKMYTTPAEKMEQRKNEPDTKEANSKQTVLHIMLITLKSRNFYVWLVVLFCMDCGIGFTTTLYKSYGQTFIQNDHFLAVVGSFSSICNSIGSPCWGVFNDRFNFKITMLCVTAIFASFTATITASEWSGEPFFFIWVCVLFVSFCGTYTALPASLSNLYGADNLGINYGLIASGIGTALLGTLLKGLIGWHGIFFLSAGIVGVGVMIGLITALLALSHRAGTVYMSWSNFGAKPMASLLHSSSTTNMKTSNELRNIKARTTCRLNVPL